MFLISIGHRNLEKISKTGERNCIVEMTEIKSNDTYFCGNGENENTAEYILLKTLIVLGTIANLSTNSLVIWKIYSLKKNTRANIMFVFLSVSDIFIGFLSFPMFALIIFGLHDLPIYIQECNLNLLVMHFPTFISWYFTVAIAIDRLLIIRYPMKYPNIITKKTLVSTLLVILIVYIGVLVISYFNREKIIATVIVATVSQLILTMTVLIAYIYILYFTRRQLKSFPVNAPNRQKAAQRLTWTIFYIFICQIICTLPGLLANFIYTSYRRDAKTERSLRYWFRFLFFSNSIVNALMLLRNQFCIKKPEDTKRKAQSSRIKLGVVIAKNMKPMEENETK